MKFHSGVNTRGIALELMRLRRERGLSVAEVGKRLDVSASTISRIETGKKESTSEEVASILTVLQVFGVERELLIERARRQNDPNLLENTASTEQSRTFLNLEQRATRIVHFELILVPGLAQTADYAHALLRALRVRDSGKDIDPWVALRMGRQAILARKNPPELHLVVTELALRQPIGGHWAMAKQVRHLLELTERPNIMINVLPTDVAEHPGLLGQFVIMDFDNDPAVVHVEAKTTGLFFDEPDKVALYKLTAQKLTGLALDGRESKRLLGIIARDHDRE
jgi:transcriptional regulator with XRE-family HTH domain